MNEKKYQVFLSSTYEDLKEERNAAVEVVISSGNFPVGMEAFPAADEDQFNFIKSIIDDCDYYILIVAGRYGAPTADGVSYTEKEYRYAVSQNIPVLVFLHNDLGKITSNKSERTDEGRAKLGAFIEEISKGRVRKTWEDIGTLKLAIREALDYAKATKPRPGWVRGDSIASLEALEELNLLRKETVKLRNKLGTLEVDMPFPEIPSHNEIVTVRLNSISGPKNPIAVESSWINMFPFFHSYLDWRHNEFTDSWYIDINSSCQQVGSALISAFSGTELNNVKITRETYEKLLSYFIEVGLMNQENADEPFSELAKRFSRRQRINSNSDSSGLHMISGNKEDIEAFDAPAIDDDVPF